MPEKKTWDVLELRVAAEASDAAEFALDDLGAIGTYYSIPARPDSDNVVVSGYFEFRIADEAISAAISKASEIYGVPVDSVGSFEWKFVEDQDWLAEWKKFWKPTVTERFIVAPPWEDIDPSGRIVIRIEPGMAFGTGTHETTKLCLNAIEDLYEPGMSFLDVGTGTGILAIAASKLTGDPEARIEACDIDEDAVHIASENAVLNSSDLIVFRTGTVDDTSGEFDIVCANLTTDVSLDLLLSLLSSSGKILILSGILAEKLGEVTAALEGHGISHLETAIDGEWAAVRVIKHSGG